jgi:hypothetical protein
MKATGLKTTTPHCAGYQLYLKVRWSRPGLLLLLLLKHWKRLQLALTHPAPAAALA